MPITELLTDMCSWRYGGPIDTDPIRRWYLGAVAGIAADAFQRGDHDALTPHHNLPVVISSDDSDEDEVELLSEDSESEGTSENSMILTVSDDEASDNDTSSRQRIFPVLLAEAREGSNEGELNEYSFSVI